MKMRICMVFNSFELPHVGGPGLQAERIAKILSNRGHQFIFVAKGRGQSPDFEFVVNGIPLYRLNIRGLASVQLFYQLWRLRDQFDIIHVHGAGRLATVAIDFAKMFGKRVHVKITTAGHIRKQYSGWKRLFNQLNPLVELKIRKLQAADSIIAISSEIIDELQRHGFADEKIYFIPNGVDTEVFRPVDRESKLMLRERLALPKFKKIFIYTGKITKRKGIDVLLKAWANAAAVNMDAVLVLIGDAAGYNDGLDEWVKTFIAEHNLADTVIWPGIVANVSDYLAAADFFIFPSWREGLSNSLLEAMASGLVCLVSEIGGNTDLIRHGSTGILVPPGNVQAWTETIRKALTDNFSPLLGQKAAQFVAQNYSLSSTANKLEQLYANSFPPISNFKNYRADC